MARPLLPAAWFYGLLFVLIGAFSYFLRILPLNTVPGAFPPPDIMLAVAVAWVLRRPEYVPVLLIAAVFLLEDFLLQRPPGLWAAIVVLGTEFLRAREALMRELSFLSEWALVAALILVLTVLERLALTLVFVPRPALGLDLLQVLITVMAYPLMVVMSYFALGLYKAAPGELDDLGKRI